MYVFYGAAIGTSFGILLKCWVPIVQKRQALNEGLVLSVYIFKRLKTSFQGKKVRKQT